MEKDYIYYMNIIIDSIYIIIYVYSINNYYQGEFEAMNPFHV